MFIIIIIIIIIIIETVGLLVPNRNFRDFSLFSVDFERRNCPSARCASAVKAIDSDTDKFSGLVFSVNGGLVSDTFAR